MFRAFLGELSALAAFALLAPGMPAAVASSKDASKAADRAVASYLQARYAEALPDLEAARDGGAAAGPHLYMLAYCYDTVKHDSEAARSTYDAAHDVLQKEISRTHPDLTSYFYLSNLFLYSRRDPDSSRKVALAGLEAIDAKKIKVGKDGTSLFRAGKIAQDAEKTDRSLDYYRRALAAFEREDSPPPAYEERALDAVARADLGKGDAAKVADQWERLVKKNPGVPRADWNLGLAALRAGRFDTAREAFTRARAVEGATNDDALYAESLARAGAELKKQGVDLPAKDEDGAALAALDASALEERLAAWARKGSDLVNAEAKEGDYLILPPKNPKGGPRLAASEAKSREIAGCWRYVVALGSEILYRGASLQENAFKGGYAPMIVQDWNDLWRLAHRSLLPKKDAVQAQPVSPGAPPPAQEHPPSDHP